ncbi:MAG: ATP-binding cassette domain-containing protein, partial [Alphaproteobacteria bacterium]|nr:ATP-binding cassette domain-containing protein [Alphaproteobacteria bacterium]
PVLKDLSISTPHGARVLISGRHETGKVALFRATAGLWTSGKGRILRPAASGINFLAEQPYLPPGTLREILVPAKLEHSISDQEINALLHELELGPLLDRAGGLNIEQDWRTLLSLGEQQMLAVIHVLLVTPHFVFLERAGIDLSPSQVRKILNMLSKNSISYINIGETDDLDDLFDAVLEIEEPERWIWRLIGAEPAN